MRTTLDASGITQLQGQLASINTRLDQMASKKLLSQKEVYAAQGDIQKLGQALSSSLNPQTGLLDLNKFQKQLNGLSLSQLEQSMSKVGATGQQAFGNMIGQIGRMDTSFKSISSFADKIFNTMGNTVRWGITASIFQTIQNSLYRAVDYVQELDTSLNNIRIVTSASNEDMRNFALYANEAAQAIGASTTSFTDAAQLYAQNGFNEEDYTRLAEITTKVANVTQQNTTDVSEQITALMEGYHMSIDQVEDSLGGMAVVAAASAADLEELATAEQKVASTANTLGVSHEQLTAQIGTIVSVTRQAPESVGNAMRTLYARIADLQMGETLEDGTTLGELSGTLADIGINVTDAEGNLRNLGDVLEELQGKWGDLSNAQQIALGTKLAGKYQLNPFMALMENADMYNEQLEMMQTSGGALEEQQSIYMDSMAAKLQQLSTAGEGVISNLFNPDDIKPGIEALTNLLNLITELINALGGLGPILTGISGLMVRTFSNQLGQSVNSMMTNISRAKARQDMNPSDVIRLMGGVGLDSQHSTSQQFIEQTASMQTRMSKEQQEAYNDTLQNTINLENQIIAAKDQQVAAQQELTRYIRMQNDKEALKVTNTLSPSGKVSESVSNYQTILANGLKNVDVVIDKLRKKIQGLNADYNKLVNGSSKNIDVAARLRDAIRGQTEALELAGVNVEDLNADLKQMSITSDPAMIEQYAKKLEEILGRIQTARQQLAQRSDEINSRVMAVDSSKDNVTGLESTLSSQKNAANLQTEQIQRQVQIQDIINVTGAVAELVFAWQTFQSLGSLWANSDLEVGDKLVQTIGNLAFTLPAIFSGVKELSQGLTALSPAAQAFQKSLKAATDLGYSAIGSISDAAIVASASLGGATAGATAFGTALKGILTSVPALLAIVSVIGIITTAFGAAQESAQQAVDNANEAAADAFSDVTDVQNNIASFNELYDTYVKTGEVTDELTSSAQTLCDALGIQGEEALITAGNYEELAKRIQEAANAQLEAGISSQRTAEEANGNVFSNLAGSNQGAVDAWNDAVAPLRNVPDFGSSGEISDDVLSYIQGDSALLRPNNALDTLDSQTEYIGYLTDAIGAMDENLEEMNSALDGMQEGTEEYDQLSAEIEALQGARDRFNELLQQEDVQSLSSNVEQGAALQEQQISNNDYSDFENMSLEDVRNVLTDANGDYDQIALYYNSLGDEAGKAYLDGLISSITMGSENVDLASEVAGENLTTALTNAINSGELSVEDNPYGSNEELVQNYVNQLNTILDSSGLSDEEKIQVLATIDENASLDEINNAIAQLNGNPELQEFSLKPEWSNRLDMDDEDFSDLESDYGVSEGAVTRMASDMYNDDEGYFQNQADSIEDQIEAIRESGDTSEEAAEKIANLSRQYNDLADEAKDTAAANVRLNKGVEDLRDNWEDLGSVLQDEASKGTSDYYEALDELDGIMSDILNIDTGVLSNDFYENADAIDAMGRAAEGDMSAIDDLRNLASQDIITHMEIQPVDGTDVEATRASLLSAQQELQNYLSSMPLEQRVNTNLDTTQFVQKLNEMLANSQITAEQASNILSSMGVSGTLTTKQGQGKVPVTTYHMEYGAATQVEGMDLGLPSSITMRPETHYETVETEIPVFEGTHYTGPGVSGVGGVSSGRLGGGGGGGGGGKKDGGGGGSGKSYEPKKKDHIEDEIDRYERVNAELDTLANRYEAVADEQERLVGFDVADNMSKQIGLIKEQIKWEEEKLKIQKEEAEEYRNQLASQYGITYDAEGHITNYANVYKKLLNELNGLIDQYNATTTESGQEALDKQIEDAQDRFDDFNDLIEDYDELVSNSILETEKEIQDFYDQIEDLQIEAFQKAVDAVDNIKDLQETLIDFNAVFTGLNSDSPFRDMITSLENLKTYWDVNTVAVDDYYDELIKRNNEAMKNASAEQKKNLEYQNKVLEAAREQYGKGTFEAGGTGLFDMAMSNLNTILEQMQQFEETGTSTIFGENSGSMYEVGNDIFEQATSLLEDYEGHIDDLRDAIIDAIDEIGDKMDERLEAYENINDELEHYADIIEMVQGENAYDQLNQVSQATIANNQATINELKQNIALWQDMLAAMEEGSEEWKTVNEYITDAQQELLEKTSDTVEEMLEMYERGVQDILDKWIGSTGMGDDLDWIAEEWELINRNADYYLDDVNAAYEIQKLQGKYLDLLDDANGLDVQNQITQQMAQQLSYLREKDKLSEYDVQYANAQLEILQKTIALQEAQRNKSQLQLRRDNQGNYSYVYTADENDTRAAQGDLLDAQNNAYNLSKDQMQQTQADSLSALQDARDTLEQIWTNANLTLEEKTKRTQTIIDSLKEYLAGTSEQLSESEKNIINDFIGMCDILTDENDERLQDVYEQIVNGNKDAFDQIDTRWQTSITNWLQNMEDFNAATDESFQGLIDNFEDYQGQLDELGDLAGMTFDDMSDSIQNAVDKTNDLASSTSSFISQLKNDAGTVKEYENALAEMTAKIQDAENGMRAYQEQVNQLQQNLTAKEQENANLTSQVKDLQSQIDAMKNPSGGSGGGGGGGGGGADSNLAWGIAQAIWTYGGASGWGNDPIRSGKLTKAYGSAFARQVQSIINQNYRSGKLVNYGSMKYSSYNLIGYDTGGYTGKDWTASEKANGKIGLLHEKELVLNKTDTENILNAVDMVRSMVALGRNGNYNDIIRQSNNVVDMASVVQPLDDMGQTIYQVECTFPNATNVDEIQRAILTLPDIAPQYAYKS